MQSVDTTPLHRCRARVRALAPQSKIATKAHRLRAERRLRSQGASARPLPSPTLRPFAHPTHATLNSCYRGAHPTAVAWYSPATAAPAVQPFVLRAMHCLHLAPRVAVRGDPAMLRMLPSPNRRSTCLTRRRAPNAQSHDRARPESPRRLLRCHQARARLHPAPRYCAPPSTTCSLRCSARSDSVRHVHR